ncbi:hypothetical protein MTO96_008553 [Rhipicephalus appendiculatus]
MKPNVLCVVAAFFAIALGQTLPKFQEKDVLHSFFCRRTGGRVVLEDTSFSFRHFLMKYEFLLYNGILNLPKKGELSGRCNTFAPNRKKDVFISCTFDLAGSVAHYDVEKKNSWRWRNDFFRIIATVKTGYLRFSVHFSKEMKKPEDVSLAVFVDPVALDISHPEGISLLAKVEKKFTAHATYAVSQTIGEALKAVCKGCEKFFLEMLHNYMQQTLTHAPTTTTQRKISSNEITTMPARTSTSTKWSFPTDIFSTGVSTTAQATSSVTVASSPKAKDFTDAISTTTKYINQTAEYTTTPPGTNWSSASSIPTREKRSTATSGIFQTQNISSGVHSSSQATKNYSDARTIVATDTTSPVETHNSSRKISPATESIPPQKITTMPTSLESTVQSTAAHVTGSTRETFTAEVDHSSGSASTKSSVGMPSDATTTKTNSEYSITEAGEKTTTTSISSSGSSSTATLFTTETEHSSGTVPTSFPRADSSNNTTASSVSDEATRIAVTTNSTGQQETEKPSTSTINSPTANTAQSGDDSTTRKSNSPVQRPNDRNIITSTERTSSKNGQSSNTAASIDLSHKSSTISSTTNDTMSNSGVTSRISQRTDKSNNAESTATSEHADIKTTTYTTLQERTTSKPNTSSALLSTITLASSQTQRNSTTVTSDSPVRTSADEVHTKGSEPTNSTGKEKATATPANHFSGEPENPAHISAEKENSSAATTQYSSTSDDPHYATKSTTKGANTEPATQPTLYKNPPKPTMSSTVNPTTTSANADVESFSTAAVGNDG